MPADRMIAFGYYRLHGPMGSVPVIVVGKQECCMNLFSSRGCHLWREGGEGEGQSVQPGRATPMRLQGQYDGTGPTVKVNGWVRRVALRLKARETDGTASWSTSYTLWLGLRQGLESMSKRLKMTSTRDKVQQKRAGCSRVSLTTSATLSFLRGRGSTSLS